MCYCNIIIIIRCMYRYAARLTFSFSPDPRIFSIIYNKSHIVFIDQSTITFRMNLQYYY